MNKLLAFWAGLPLSVTGGIIRAVRTGIAGVMGALVAGVVTGSLFTDVENKGIVVIVGMAILGFDKWLRQHNYEVRQAKLLAAK